MMDKAIRTEFKRIVQQNLVDGHALDLMKSCYDKEVEKRTSYIANPFSRPTPEEIKGDAMKKAGDLLAKLCAMNFDREIEMRVAELVAGTASNKFQRSEEWLHKTIHADDVLLPPNKCVAIWVNFLDYYAMIEAMAGIIIPEHRRPDLGVAVAVNIALAVAGAVAPVATAVSYGGYALYKGAKYFFNRQNPDQA